MKKSLIILGSTGSIGSETLSVIKKKDFNNIIKQKGLFVFPSGPGLATIENEFKYLESLRNSDYVFFDSGYLVILLKIN